MSLNRQFQAAKAKPLELFINAFCPDSKWSICLTDMGPAGRPRKITHSGTHTFVITAVTSTADGFSIATDHPSELIDHKLSSDFLVKHPIEISEAGVRDYNGTPTLSCSCKTQKRDRFSENRMLESSIIAELAQQTPDCFKLALFALNKQANFIITRKN